MARDEQRREGAPGPGRDRRWDRPREGDPRLRAVRAVVARALVRSRERERRAERRLRAVPGPERHGAPALGAPDGERGDPGGPRRLFSRGARRRVVDRREPRELVHLRGPRGEARGLEWRSRGVGARREGEEGEGAGPLRDGDVVDGRRGNAGTFSAGRADPDRDRERRGGVEGGEAAERAVAHPRGRSEAPRQDDARAVGGDEERRGGVAERRRSGVAEVRRRRHGAHLRGVAAEDAQTPARGGVPHAQVLVRGAGDEEVVRPRAARERDRRHAVGVPGEGARESRARVAGADQDDDVTRGVRAERPVGAAPVREAGPVPVRRGGHGDGVVRARRGVRHGDRRVGTSDGHPGRSELSREHPGVRVLSRTATATARVACARHDAPSTSRRRSRRRGVRAAGT